MRTHSGYIMEVDGLKGLGILSLLVFHSFWFPLFFGLMQASSGGFDFWAQRLLASGWVGLDLLMVVTGYHMTKEMLKRPSYQSFYWRRFVRIAPPYFLFLMAWFGLAYLYPVEMTKGHDPLALISFWTFWQNFYMVFAGPATTPLPLQHLWTVALLVQTCLIWPLIGIALKPRHAVVACGALILLCPLLRLALVGGDDPFESTYAYLLTPMRLDTFAWGALVAFAGSFSSSKSEGQAGWWKSACLISLAALAGTFAWRNGLNTDDPVTLTIGLSLLGCFFASLLALVMPLAEWPESGLASRLLCFPLLRSMGRYSYGLYLYHQPVILALILKAYLPGAGWSPFVLFSLLGSCASLLVAMASFYFWERRFIVID